MSCNGNDPGCKNGQIFCTDPRCYPDCTNCKINTGSGNWIIILIILILLGVLLIMSFIVGFDWYKKTKKAEEPKHLMVNKHIHNIQQPPIVVSSPMLSAPVVSAPVVSAPAVSTSISPPDLTNVNPVSYNGISLDLPCED